MGRCRWASRGSRLSWLSRVPAATPSSLPPSSSAATDQHAHLPHRLLVQARVLRCAALERLIESASSITCCACVQVQRGSPAVCAVWGAGCCCEGGDHHHRECLAQPQNRARDYQGLIAFKLRAAYAVEVGGCLQRVGCSRSGRHARRLPEVGHCHACIMTIFLLAVP